MSAARDAWELVGVPDGAPDAVLADLTAFGATLAAHGAWFTDDRPVHVARAPGRLDLMGGIADYSGSLVLELPLACAAMVAVQASDDGFVRVHSPDAASAGLALRVDVPLDALAPGGRVLPYDAARALLAADPRAQWAAYAIGTVVVLAHARAAAIGRGLRMLVHSTVPAGKGVSSSAALEVAAMQATAAALGLTLDGRELALLCQRAENLVVGAPCGVMDQMTSACGEADRLLALRCQPAEIEGQVALPPELAVWGIDSGIRHAVGGADYGAVRVGAFMGHRILAEVAGLAVEPLRDGRVRIDDAAWGGYLANVTPSAWTSRYRAHVPETMLGADFLARHGGIVDTATRVEPARRYAVRAPTAHPIHEHQRVRTFRALLDAGAGSEEVRTLLGELMYQSHASYSACGLGADGTDRLVELVREAGPASGLYGAKITGGGSGGVVAVLGRREAESRVAQIVETYTRETGRASALLGGSSPGAVAFGTVRARRTGPR